MSNSNKMSLEEKIVQSLKDETLYKLVGDEDAITTLVERAIREALFQPQRRTDNYGRHVETRDSVVVEAARERAKIAAEAAAEGMIKSIMEDEKVVQTMKETIAEVFPQIMIKALQEAMTGNAFNEISRQQGRLRQELIAMDIPVQWV